MGSRPPAPDPEEDPEPAASASQATGGNGAGVPAAPEAATDDGDDPGTLAPCDDPRWATLVQSVDSKTRLLGARLRDAEVRRIEGDGVEVALRGKPLAASDVALVEGEGRPIFGPAFRLMWIDATSKEYRARRSLAGRKLWRDERAKAQERAEAEADPAVQQARRFFPNSKVVQVKLADPAARTPDAS
jgi:hypothetical protein